MSGGRIYLRRDATYVPMIETPYSAEDILQRHLADLPDLLAGDQMTPDDPRRWLLVEREVGVPGQSGGLGRWSLDHLFLDQDAMPTFVEVKRSSNTQIRREIVGQMLDYAANATEYWPAGRVRSLLEERTGASASEAVLALLGSELLDDEIGEQALAEVEAFWELVDENLTKRRIRMIFAADEIPRELQRIIEFLNANMVDAEIYGVEVHQFKGEGVETLVPRLIGQTLAAADVKRTPVRTKRVVRAWDPTSFLVACADTGGRSARTFAEEIGRWAEQLGIETEFGAGKYGPMYAVAHIGEATGIKVCAIDTQGKFTVNYSHLQYAAPFDEEGGRLELNRRLNLIDGIDIDDDYARRSSWPTLDREALLHDETRRAVLETLTWAVDEMRRRGSGSPDPTV